MRGVTQKNYDAYRKTLNQPRADVRGITDAEVQDFYFTRYWRPAGCAVLTACGADRLALLHFDAAVNHGVGRAVIFLQLELAATPDGVFGPLTEAALRRSLENPDGEDELIDGYLLRRMAFYHRIVQTNPSQAVFARGWSRRMERVRAHIIR